MSTFGRRKKELTPSEKNSIAQFLINKSTNGSVHRGAQAEAATSFGVTVRCIQYIWAATKQQQANGQPAIFISKKVGIKHTGRVNGHLDEEKMKSIPFEKRGTIRRLAKEMDLSKSTIGRWIKQGAIKPHTNAIKPDLTPGNKVQRIKYCLNALKIDNLNNKIMFDSMHNVVHIDEKWFYMTRTKERGYLLPGEPEPHRTCKSKRFITKIMFMCAVARPQYSSDGALVFDGKIGIFPFTSEEPAQRNSKNRVRGTMITKPIESITKAVIKGCLINQIIPAIKAKWPASASKHIYIQQDNARPHINNLDLEFRAAANSDGFNIQLICQPPNSPDTNINDLGWFRAIQSLQVETRSYKVDELMKCVILSFDELTHITLNNVFISLQGCMIEIMKLKGQNNYKVPHLNKWRRIRDGTLPFILEVDEVIVRESIQYLVDSGHIDHATHDFAGLMSSLGYD